MMNAKFKTWILNLILILSSGLTLSCSVFYKQFYTDPVQCYREALKRAPLDVAIIPGFPYQKDSINFILENRAYWALHLYKKGMVKNFIFSGSSVYSPYVEGQILKLYAEALGIPSECIFVESQAEHSMENLYYSYKIAKRQGFNSIVFATDPAQSSFVKSVNNKRFKIQVSYLPILYDTLLCVERHIPEIDVQTAKVSSFVSILEREGVLKRLRGTRGHKVKRTMRRDKKALKNK